MLPLLYFLFPGQAHPPIHISNQIIQSPNHPTIAALPTKEALIDLDGLAGAADHVAAGRLQEGVRHQVPEHLLVVDEGGGGEVGRAVGRHHHVVALALVNVHLGSLFKPKTFCLIFKKKKKKNRDKKNTSCIFCASVRPENMMKV